MDSITETLKQLSELGFSPLNLVLLIMLYFMGAHSGLFPRFWDKKDSDKRAPTIKDLHEQVTKLHSYFNHETTGRLDKIDKKHDTIITGVDDLKRTHQEYEKFGIKVRKQT